MPVYNYRCKDCGEYFAMAGDYMTLFSYKPECPDCKSENVQKLIQKVDVIYKGKGFYNTDNKAKKEKAS